jgi:hypothetical protein
VASRNRLKTKAILLALPLHWRPTTVEPTEGAMSERMASGWRVLGLGLIGWMAAAARRADPLAELRERLPSLRSEEPVRLEVEVETRERGSGPRHLRAVRRRGDGVLVYGKHGPEVRATHWRGYETRVSFWERRRHRSEEPFLTEENAADFVDPAGVIATLLDGAVLLDDVATSFAGRPARQLTFRPGLLAPKAPRDDSEPPASEHRELPVTLTATVWLDSAGNPLALERDFLFSLGPALASRHQQLLTFELVDGRLLGNGCEETYSGSALAVFGNREDRTIHVVSAP